MYTICTHENRLNKLFKNNNLTIDQRTENPRVGGSIPSRPTSLTHLKLGTYRVFVSIFFYFFPLNFTEKVQTEQRFRVDLLLFLALDMYTTCTHRFWVLPILLIHEHD